MSPVQVHRFALRRDEFSVENLAGGDYRVFRWTRDDLPAAALRHINQIGYGGPAFDGPMATEAAARWEEIYFDEAEDKS